MELIQVDLDSHIFRKSAVALGNFDGIHMGHRVLINGVVEMSRDLNCASSVLIFKTHTKNMTEGASQELLTSQSQKHDILRSLGIDIIYEMDFTKSVMNLSPKAFVMNFLSDHLNVQGVVVGYDYRFGSKASGNVNTLRELCRRNCMSLVVKEAVKYQDKIVSSTRVRTAIKEGDVKSAAELLLRPFTIRGTVTKGKQLGRTIGVPTANILYDTNYVVPKFGVYMTQVKIDDSYYFGATNIGTNPTFSEQEVKVETYLFDYCGDSLYGKTIDVALIDFIRPEIAFRNVKELKMRMDDDLSLIRQKISKIDFTF